jgi:mono/diheme cytochrome c family protein
MRLSRRGYIALALVSLAVGALLLGRVLFWRETPSPSPAATTASPGRVLYETHCAVCHGRTGKGDGPGALVHRQPMRDFSDSAAMREVNDAFLFEIIKKGSSQFGRSNAMPSWGMKLSDEEIRVVVGYIRSLASERAAGPGGRKETP